MAKFFVKFFRVIRNRKVLNYIPKGSYLLDVGCGSDFYLLESAKSVIKKGVGIDIAVRNMKKSNITIKRMSISEKLPFKDAAFDVVTMIAFIEHTDKPGQVLAECKRVLKKGGRIIITTPMEKAKPFWEMLVNLGFTEEKTTKDHKHYFTQAEIEKLLKRNEFKILVSDNFEAGMNYIAVGEKK